MMRPIGPFVCRSRGADRVVPKVPIGVVPSGLFAPITRRLADLEWASGSDLASNRPGSRYGLRLMEAEIPGVDRPIEVIIADDHTVVRDGIRMVLEREAGEFRVVAEAADVPSTIREVRAHKPDLLTLDLSMPGGSSLAALPQCFVAHPTLAVAILTMREDPEYARQALRAGARSYVLKEAEPTELLQAFRLAVAGGNYLHPRLGALLATGEDSDRDGGAALSEREREVVRLIALGHTNPQIAEQLHVAERTVKTYRARAIEKLGFSSRAEITAWARRLGLVE
jgi:two-component system, NarL family, response regulator NreC